MIPKKRDVEDKLLFGGRFKYVSYTKIKKGYHIIDLFKIKIDTIIIKQKKKIQ